MNGVAAGAAFVVAAAAAAAVSESGKSVEAVIDMVADHPQSHPSAYRAAPPPTVREAPAPAEAPVAAPAQAPETRNPDPFNTMRAASTMWEYFISTTEHLLDSDFRLVTLWARNLAPFVVLVIIIALLDHSLGALWARLAANLLNF